VRASSRGRTTRGRLRETARTAVWERSRTAPPLKKLVDQGGSDILTHEEVGAPDPIGWPDAFFSANRRALERLGIAGAVRIERSRAVVALTSHDRLGAVPLQSPVTRKVVAGLLVLPRFGWPSVGRVLSDVGFRIEPDVGGMALVPGSAREVPPWVLAGPVIARLAAAIGHLARTFVPTVAEREMPRGTVDWGAYARKSLPAGRWAVFRCSYSDLSDDPHLVAALRWTLKRIGQDLEPAVDVVIARRLLEQIDQLLRHLGPGPAQRPRPGDLVPALASDWMRMALEAVAWVRDERGLGGARSLDGLPWSLAVSSIWEAWVESFLTGLTRRMGGRLTTARQGMTRRPLIWRSATRSLGHLAPDFLLELSGRLVGVDAKYKDHLSRIAHEGWNGLAERLRESHRADLHQALAYAALGDAPRVDTLLVYPQARDGSGPVMSIAEVAGRGRHIRVGLASIPFGFEGPADREAATALWEQTLRTAE
jgi:hypothetical protein